MYKFLFEHPYGRLSEETTKLFSTEVSLFVSFFILLFLQLKQTVLFIQGAHILRFLCLCESFMSAHPEILGDISCEQSHGAPHPLPWRDSSWEPLPTALLQRQVSAPATTARCGHLAGGERELAPPWDAMGGELVSHWEGHHGWEAPLWEFHHWCPVAQGAGRTHVLQQRCCEELVTWEPGGL